MTFSEFTTKVKYLILVDGDDPGSRMGAFLNANIRAALIELQERIPAYRKEYIKTFDSTDFVIDGNASVGQFPDEGFDTYLPNFTSDETPVEVSYVHYSDTETFVDRLVKVPWSRRFDMAGYRYSDNSFLWCYNNLTQQFYVTPPLTPDSNEHVVFRGTRIVGNWVDEDAVPFGEEVVPLVSDYVKWKLSLDHEDKTSQARNYFGNYARGLRKLMAKHKSER